jgi:hypothetical protein
MAEWKRSKIVNIEPLAKVPFMVRQAHHGTGIYLNIQQPAVRPELVEGL